VLTRLFHRDLVDEVIAETGRREQRSRLLPAHVVVYFVLAMTLFAGEGYEEVMRRLVGGLRFLRSWSSHWTVPSTSAISQARARLGEEPLRELFDRVATPSAAPGDAGCWFGRFRVMAIDGVVLDTQDTGEQRGVQPLQLWSERERLSRSAGGRSRRVRHAGDGGGRDRVRPGR
jgi:hypothetical protein